MNYTKLIQDISQTILVHVKKAIDSEKKSDQTFLCRITEALPENSYIVTYSGKSYRVSSSIPCVTGDFVRVCAPCGDWNDLYVAENKSKKMAGMSDLKNLLLIPSTGGFSGDINNISTPGLYGQIVDSQAANGPGFSCYLLVFAYDNTEKNCTQTAIGYNESRIAMRFRYGGSWSAWVEK